MMVHRAISSLVSRSLDEAVFRNPPVMEKIGVRRTKRVIRAGVSLRHEKFALMFKEQVKRLRRRISYDADRDRRDVRDFFYFYENPDPQEEVDYAFGVDVPDKYLVDYVEDNFPLDLGMLRRLNKGDFEGKIHKTAHRVYFPKPGFSPGRVFHEVFPNFIRVPTEEEFEKEKRREESAGLTKPVDKVKRDILKSIDQAEAEYKRAVKRIDELTKAWEKRYLKSIPVPSFAKKVPTDDILALSFEVPIKLRGWYIEDEEGLRKVLKKISPYNHEKAVVTVVFVDQESGEPDGSFSPSDYTMKVFVRYNLESVSLDAVTSNAEGTFKHELRHWGQVLLKEYKKLHKKAGFPSRNVQDKRQSSYRLTDIEFHPHIGDAIDRFAQEVELTKSLERRPVTINDIRQFVKTDFWFRILKSDRRKWREAVKIFTKAAEKIL